MGDYLGPFSEASDRFEFQELGGVAIIAHVNQHLRKIGHLTVPRCLAGGGGVTLICVDTYIFFTAVLNISLIGG